MRNNLNDLRSTQRNWRSLNVEDTPNGYKVSEPLERFRVEAVVEGTLLAVAVSLLFASYLHWIVPLPGVLGESSAAQTSLSVLLLVSGLVLYAFATRGFRRQVRMNLQSRELWLSKINGRGVARIQRSIPLDKIDSLFVRRVHGQEEAELHLRRKSGGSEFCILRGELADLEALHGYLCTDVKPTVRARKPVVQSTKIHTQAAANRPPAQVVRPRRVVRKTG